MCIYIRVAFLNIRIIASFVVIAEYTCTCMRTGSTVHTPQLIPVTNRKRLCTSIKKHYYPMIRDFYDINYY